MGVEQEKPGQVTVPGERTYVGPRAPASKHFSGEQVPGLPLHPENESFWVRPLIVVIQRADGTTGRIVT